MATPILPDRTHPFQDGEGTRWRIIQREDGGYLEHVNSLVVFPSFVEGPEILKLASEGRKVWRALRELLHVLPKSEMGFEYDEADRAAGVLRATGQTFDHNEPNGSAFIDQPSVEVSVEVVDLMEALKASLKRRDPERPIPLVGPEEARRGD